MSNESFGDYIRKSREGKKLPLRKVAAHLDIDQSTLSKVERGERPALPENQKQFAGINVDHFIALAQRKGFLFNVNEKDTKEAFIESIQDDILNARYLKAMEEGILQLIDDICSGTIEIRAHNSKKLHSKFYIFLSP